MRIATKNQKTPKAKTNPLTTQTTLTVLAIALLSCRSLPTPTNTPATNNQEHPSQEANPDPTSQLILTFTDAQVTTSTPTYEVREPQPPFTPLPLATPVVATPVPPVIYRQGQSPVYLFNFLYPELGCNWSGVAGQIFGPSGNPIQGLVVEVSGKINGQDYLGISLSGLALPIGPGGFAIQLDNRPFDSHHALLLRVLDLNGNQLSETFPLTTYNDCRKNLILMNFILASAPLSRRVYFPLIQR